MSYETRYKEMQGASGGIMGFASDLNGFATRLSTIRSQMQSTSALAHFRSAVGNRANAVRALSSTSSKAGKCLDSAREEYLSGEKKAHGAIAKTTLPSGFVSAVGVGAVVCTGATATNSSTVKSDWWDKIKAGAKAAYSTGAKAVKAGSNVVSKIKKEIGSGGRFEGAWKAVTSTTKLVSGAILLTTSVATFNPIGMAYGANMLISSGHDLYQISEGNYNKVGDLDLLKSAVTKTTEAAGVVAGAGIGYLVGGAEGAKTGATIGKSAGSKLGSIAYTAGGIYASASVGKTVVGNATISELTKVPVYDSVKDISKAIDAVAKDEFAGYVAGKFVGESIGDYIKSDPDMPKELDVFNEVLKKGGEKIAEGLGNSLK